MAEYRLLTIWHFEAPLEVVYAAIHDSPRWPDWWPGVKKVELVTTGDTDGINSVVRYCLHGRLPYRMTFRNVSMKMRHRGVEIRVAREAPGGQMSLRPAG